MNLSFFSAIRWAGMVVCLIFVTMSAHAFVLELEDDTRTIQLTPEFKEAALKASLPLFSDFAHKLQLPVPYPLTRSDVVVYGMTPFQRKNTVTDTVFIETKQGIHLSLFLGVVRGFSWPDSYLLMQNAHTISNYFGTVKITREQAILSARETLSKVGIAPDDLFAEQEPDVEVPTWGTNTVARYMIKWHDPRGGANAPVTVSAEINAQTGRVESFEFSPVNGLKKLAPEVSVIPPRGNFMFDSMIPPAMSPDYAWKLIPIMFTAIDAYAKKLSLPVPYPLTTNNVAKVEAHNNDGWPHCEIWTTNGWHFIYRHTMVNGFYAPDNFFDSNDRKIHIRDFDGRWNLTTNQAIETVRRAMAKLDYPTNNVHMDFQPNAYASSMDMEHVPRLRFEWYYSVQDELQSRLEAEVNMDSGKLESLYYDDKAYWNARPPINVPISTDKKEIPQQ